MLVVSCFMVWLLSNFEDCVCVICVGVHRVVRITFGFSLLMVVYVG